MRIQAITPTYTDRANIQNQNNSTRVINSRPVKLLEQADVQTPAMPKTDFSFIKNIFSSPLSQKMTEVKNIKDENGDKRYDKDDLKAIKKHLKNDEITVEILKDFAPTNLDVKGISEAYLFSKETQNSQNEQKNILTAVKNFEKAESSQQSNEQQTRLEREDDGKYQISNADNTHRATYKADGEKISECTITYNPDYQTKTSNSSSDNKTNNFEDKKEEEKPPLSPYHPFNPKNPFNWFGF